MRSDSKLDILRDDTPTFARVVYSLPPIIISEGRTSADVQALYLFLGWPDVRDAYEILSRKPNSICDFMGDSNSSVE